MKCLPIRLTPGEDLRRALEAAAVSEWPGGAFVVAGIGSLTGARLRLAAAEAETLVEGPLEVLSLSGTVSADGAHLHISVATTTGQILGGHLGYGCLVRTTAEVLLVNTPGWQLSRAVDAGTGHRELVVRRLESGDDAGQPGADQH